MKTLKEMMDQKEASKDWSRSIAEKVLLKKRTNGRRAEFAILALAASIVVIAGVVSVNQKAREDSFKYVFNSALDEVLPGYDSSSIVLTGINK